VEAVLREGILSGELPPGSRLPPERKLSEELGVNRSSVREAIRRLESQRLVVSRQGDGTRVLDFLEQGSLSLVSALLLAGGQLDQALLADLLELRTSAGALIARLAARRLQPPERPGLQAALRELEAAGGRPAELPAADLALFVALARIAKNRVLRLLLNLLVQPYLQFAPVLAGLTEHPAQLVGHAQQLVAAVLAGEEDAAAAAAHEYLETGRRGLLQQLGGRPADRRPGPDGLSLEDG